MTGGSIAVAAVRAMPNVTIVTAKVGMSSVGSQVEITEMAEAADQEGNNGKDQAENKTAQIDTV
jgi:hypothetical protein